MDHYQEVMVALSESVMKKNLCEAPLGGGLMITSYPVGNTT